MRILKVTQAYYPFQNRGGPAIKVRSISRELVKKGHTVTVLTADLGFGPKEIDLAAAVRNGQGWRSDLDGVETLYFHTRLTYRNLTLNSGVATYCRRELHDFDIVHIYGLYDLLGPTVAKRCRRFNIPYFVEPLGMTRPIDRGFFLKKVWWKLLGGYLAGASKIIATSELEKAEILAQGYHPHQVMLRYNGIDREEFASLPPLGSFRSKLGLGDGERLILFLGRLIPRKGADLLIEALPQLARENVRLVIAGPEGEAGYLRFLQDKARDLGVSRQTLFIAPLYGNDKLAALADATVFALPSRYENFGNVAAEAIACGTPAVVTDRCGIAPLITQRAGLVTSYDVGSVARILKELLDNAALYERLKQGCARVADEISWDRLVSDMEQAYQKATDQFSRSAA